MCGIFCAINSKKGFAESEVKAFEKALNIIDYRGPDGSGIQVYNFESSSQAERPNLFLGHNRLSIIDLSDDGSQPMNYKDDYVIIFNGEIYNYLEIKDWLKSQGLIFKTNSDTEVILALYEYGGEEAFEKLNGMWAFVIYDKKKNKLVVSRDRFGEKPLYFIEDNKGGFFFSSEIKQLLPFVNPEINIDVLSSYLHSYLLDYSNETFFKGVKKIPQGTNFVYDFNSEKITQKKYWNFSLNDNLSAKSESELIEEFRSLFIDAIKIRLRSDVVIGNTLSGGLDSSSIAVIASKMMSDSFQNISVITKNKKITEEHFIDSLIQENKLNVKKIDFDSQDPLSIAENVIWHHDEPILSISTIAHYQMMQLLSEKTNITVVLSGQGGDEALAGYNKYYFYAVKQYLSDRAFSKAFKTALPMINKIGNEFNLLQAKRYTGFGGGKGVLFENLLQIDKSANSLSSFSDFKDRQLQDYYKFSVPPLCHYEDRNSMAFSKEIRLPFLDHRLAEFCVNLPLDLKIKNGFSKYILRKSIHELPQSIAWRKDKKGFSLDEDLYFTGENLNFSRNILANSELGKLGFIDQKKLDQSIKGSNPKIWSRDLSRLVFTEIWLNKFFD